MNKAPNIKLHNLIDRFFEGETTNEEELILIRYFNTNDIADDLLKYKPVFLALADTKLEFILKEPAQVSFPKKHKDLWWKFAVAIVLIGFIPSYLLLSKPKSSIKKQLYIENQKKTYDIEIRMPDLEITIENAVFQEMEFENILTNLLENDLFSNFDKLVWDEVHIITNTNNNE